MEELMSTRLPKKDKYERKDLYGIARKCDIFVHNSQILNISGKQHPRFIFISALLGNITLPFFINNVLSKLSNPVTLIIASEDYTFPNGNKDSRINLYKDLQSEVYYVINHPLVEKIYVENLDKIHPKLHPLPLGIHPVDDLKYLKLYMPLQLQQDMQWERKYDVLCNHRIREESQFDDRKTVANLCKTVWKSFVT